MLDRKGKEIRHWKKSDNLVLGRERDEKVELERRLRRKEKLREMEPEI